MYIFVMVGDKSFGLEYDYFLPKEAVTFGRGCHIGSHVENEEQVDPESYKNWKNKILYPNSVFSTGHRYKNYELGRKY